MIMFKWDIRGVVSKVKGRVLHPIQQPGSSYLDRSSALSLVGVKSTDRGDSL